MATCTVWLGESLGPHCHIRRNLLTNTRAVIKGPINLICTVNCLSVSTVESGLPLMCNSVNVFKPAVFTCPTALYNPSILHKRLIVIEVILILTVITRCQHYNIIGLVSCWLNHAVYPFQTCVLQNIIHVV